MSDELIDAISKQYSALRAEHTCKEIIEGVWEHTWTPHSSYTSTQSADSITADELLKISEGIKDLLTQEWLEEYDRYSRASMLREIEETNKSTPYSYLRYWYPQIQMPSVRMLPYIAEGTPVERRKRTRPSKRERRQHRAAFRRRKRGLA